MFKFMKHSPHLMKTGLVRNGPKAQQQGFGLKTRKSFSNCGCHGAREQMVLLQKQQLVTRKFPVIHL